MKTKKKPIIIGIVVLVIIRLLIRSYFVFRNPWKFRENRPIKIFFLHSFHPEFPVNLVEGYTLGFEQFFEDLKERSKNIPDVEFIARDIIEDYSDFQTKVMDYQDKVDALLFSPPIDYRYENGSFVPMQIVIHWVAANSNIPKIVLWDLIESGFLGAVVVSPENRVRNREILLMRF